MSENKSAEIAEVQSRVFGSKWTRLENTLSGVRYPEAAASWLMSWALEQSGVLKQPGADVMEFGFGHGRQLLRFPSSSRIHGVELSKVAVDDLARRLAQRAFAHVDLRWTPEGGMSVPWPDRSFDTVLCSHVIEHVPDDEHLIGEFARVLKPGGRAHLLVPLDASEEQGWIDQAQRRNPNFPETSFHVWNYNLRTFTTLVERAGLRVDLAVRRDALLSARSSWPRPIQMASSLAFSILPRRLWWATDNHYLDRHLEGKQAAVVARRPA